MHAHKDVVCKWFPFGNKFPKQNSISFNQKGTLKYPGQTHESMNSMDPSDTPGVMNQ